MDYSNGIKVVIGNYGSYASGQLRDQAITLPVSNSELQEFLRQNGLVTPMHEETYIADFPDGAPFGNLEIFDHVSVQDMNLLAKQMEMTEPDDLDKVEEWIDAFHDPKNVTQLMNLIAQANLIEKVDFEYTDGNSPEENYGFYILDQNPDLKEAMAAAGIAVDYYKTGYDNSVDEVTLTDTGFFVNSGKAPKMDKFSHEDLIDMYGDDPMEEVSLDANVKDWYMKEFSTDDLGAEIVDGLSFQDIYDTLAEGNGENIYDVVGVGDSLVRERIFGQLAELAGTSYEKVYDAWLHGNRDNELPAIGQIELSDMANDVRDASDHLHDNRDNAMSHGIDAR